MAEENTQQTTDSKEEETSSAAETTEETAEQQAPDASESEASTTDQTQTSAGGDTAEAQDTEDAESDEVEVPEKFQPLIETVEQMSVLELNELVKVLEKKFGVSAAAVAVAGGGGGEAGGEEEKSEFNVELTAVGDQKVQVIKVVKNALGLGLKEAKDMADNLPAVLKEGMPKEEAEELKKQVEEVGGSVELK